MQANKVAERHRKKGEGKMKNKDGLSLRMPRLLIYQAFRVTKGRTGTADELRAFAQELIENDCIAILKQYQRDSSIARRERREARRKEREARKAQIKEVAVCDEDTDSASAKQ